MGKKESGRIHKLLHIPVSGSVHPPPVHLKMVNGSPYKPIDFNDQVSFHEFSIPTKQKLGVNNTKRNHDNKVCDRCQDVEKLKLNDIDEKSAEITKRLKA